MIIINIAAWITSNSRTKKKKTNKKYKKLKTNKSTQREMTENQDNEDKMLDKMSESEQTIPENDAKMHQCLQKQDNKSKSGLSTRTDEHYLRHLNNLKTIEPLVDNRAPLLKIRKLLHDKETDFMRIKEITKENEVILQRINVIQRTRGVIDTYNRAAATTGKSIRLKAQLTNIEKTEKENLALFKSIWSIKPVIDNKELAKDWKKNLRQIKLLCKHEYVPKPLKKEWGPEELAEITCLLRCPKTPRAKVYFEFAFRNGSQVGRLEFVLFDDIVPNLVANFMNCLNGKAMENFDDEEEEYQQGCCTHLSGLEIRRIYPQVFAEFGVLYESSDMSDAFTDEDLVLPGCFTGALAMIPRAKGKLSSKYIITFKPLSDLNNTFAVFGRAVDGLKTLLEIEFNGRKHGQPLKEIFISDCGVIRPKHS